MILSTYNPKDVFAYFEKICSIPHESGNTKAISDYCVDFAKEHDLQWYQDDLNNIIITKEATKGYENADTLILQGHLDMVGEKEKDKVFDFSKDPIEPIVNGDIITANGTTLGADNGIAVAMSLALLADDSLSHPKIEALFTVDEETGMDGAFGLDCSKLTGHKLINLDSEYEGVLMCSCAGGIDANIEVPIQRGSASKSTITIEINNLTSGHSGVEIDKGRANANVLIARLLYGLMKKYEFSLVNLQGGNKATAIAAQSKATIAVDDSAIDKMLEDISAFGAIFKTEYATTEPNMSVAASKESAHDVNPLTMASTKQIVSLLVSIPDAVQEMSVDMPGLVQTSLNFGILALEDDKLKTLNCIRSAMTTQKQMILERLEALAFLAGGTCESGGDYPGWAFRPNSDLRDTICKAYKSITGKDMAVEAVHAGIECGLFADNIKDFDGVSLGPTMGEVHTPKEFLSISSVERTYDLLKAVLKESK
ncbi:dipeptidase D [Clostridiales Family XIII bacterium PM5-7]